MEQFIRAIEEGMADIDHDGRSSVYEVCSRAASLTAAWYEDQGFIASEHALLEDNGDGLGTRLPVEANVEEVNADGNRAKTVYVKHPGIAANVPDDLIQVYESSIRAIEDLKRTKAELPETVYYEKLEALLIQAAKASRAIRDVPTATEAAD
jgi:hypothetical protein